MIVKDVEEAKDILRLEQLSKLLQHEIIPRLIQDFDDMELMPFTSAELEAVFHSHGVNMRYLGQVAYQVTQHHMKLMCFVEMLARTAKNILFDNISLIIKQKSIAADGGSVESFDRELREHLIDFLNLLFGDSEESSAFWNDVLFLRASLYY